jgi:hypothetical protein
MKLLQSRALGGHKMARHALRHLFLVSALSLTATSMSAPSAHADVAKALRIVARFAPRLQLVISRAEHEAPEIARVVGSYVRSFEARQGQHFTRANPTSAASSSTPTRSEGRLPSRPALSKTGVESTLDELSETLDSATQKIAEARKEISNLNTGSLARAGAEHDKHAAKQ